MGLAFGGDRVEDDAKTMRRLSRLAEFETPINFDCDFDFDTIQAS